MFNIQEKFILVYHKKYPIDNSYLVRIEDLEETLKSIEKHHYNHDGTPIDGYQFFKLGKEIFPKLETYEKIETVITKRMVLNETR